MKLILILLVGLSYCILFNKFEFKKNTIQNSEIVVTIRDFGKISDNIDLLVKITKIDKGNFTSSLYFSNCLNDSLKSLPIDDSKFNYSFFEKKDLKLIINKKVKLCITKYISNQQSVELVTHIQFIN
jgi:hypothetical protein